MNKKIGWINATDDDNENYRVYLFEPIQKTILTLGGELTSQAKMFLKLEDGTDVTIAKGCGDATRLQVKDGPVLHISNWSDCEMY